MKRSRLKKKDYQVSDPVVMAHFLLGKLLCVQSSEGLVSGWITETEAYGGAEDKACHGYANRRTARTEMLFHSGGVSYVYLCYGIHPLLNFVTGEQDQLKAVLIRGLKVFEGKEVVRRRRRGIQEKNWTDGPGKVSQALGIKMEDNGLSLQGDRLWVEDASLVVPLDEILMTPRIGVDYAGEWAKKPWRFLWFPKKSLP